MRVLLEQVLEVGEDLHTDPVRSGSSEPGKFVLDERDHRRLASLAQEPGVRTGIVGLGEHPVCRDELRDVADVVGVQDLEAMVTRWSSPRSWCSTSTSPTNQWRIARTPRLHSQAQGSGDLVLGSARVDVDDLVVFGGVAEEWGRTPRPERVGQSDRSRTGDRVRSLPASGWI
jgi:hypothetical protein